MTRTTPAELAARLRAAAEMGSEIQRQARVVTPTTPPPGGPPAEKREKPDLSGLGL